MPDIFRIEQFCHWYTVFGEPMHEIQKPGKPVIEYVDENGALITQVIGKNGKARAPRAIDCARLNLTRTETIAPDYWVPTTPKIAAELGLLPSPSNILGVYRQRHIETYEKQMVLDATKAVPFTGDWLNQEDLYDHVIKETAQYHKDQRIKAGGQVHELLAKGHGLLMLNQPLDILTRDPLWVYVDEWFNWLTTQNYRIVDIEQVTVSPLGYAGTIDLVVEIDGYLCVIDFKTRELGQAKYPSTYPSNIAQIASYVKSYNHEAAAMLITIDMHPETEGVVFFDRLREDEIETHFSLFLSLFEIWIIDRGYNPLENPIVLEHFKQKEAQWNPKILANAR